VKLSQSGIGDDVILARIRKSGAQYDLNADQIIYLHSQKVSERVIEALLQGNSGPAAPVQATQTALPSPGAPVQGPDAHASGSSAPSVGPDSPTNAEGQPPVNLDYFRSQLSPFGTWVQVDPYGLCWRPDRAIAANPDWRPYYDMGRWVYTENGWFWASDYGWGDIPFHYGRWVLEPAYGWLWVPDYTWGPAWVFWRHGESDGCIGWAPLPYGAVFVGDGWEFHHRRVGVEFDFGLGEGVFVFVGYYHFHDGFLRLRGREYAYHIRRERIHEFYGRTVLRNEFRRDEHGRFVNEGLGHARVEHLTGRRVEVTHFDERRPIGDREKLTQRSTGSTAAAQHSTATAATASKVYRPPATTAAKPAPQQASQKNSSTKTK
jgi:hypothetical protein